MLEGTETSTYKEVRDEILKFYFVVIQDFEVVIRRDWENDKFDCEIFKQDIKRAVNSVKNMP